MPFTKFVDVGRIVFIAFGPNAGKIATIVDVIDQNRALIEGPVTGVKRQSCNFKRMHLTKFRIKIQHSAGTNFVAQAWRDAKIGQKWGDTAWAKKLKNKTIKEGMNDFDRFKLMNAKVSRNKVIKREFGILKRRARRLAPKPKPKLTKAAKKLLKNPPKVAAPEKTEKAKKVEKPKPAAAAKKGEGKKPEAKKGDAKAPATKKADAPKAKAPAKK